MATERSIRLRGARDRLIDLLGLGETFPLQDAEVRNERLTVPIGDSARIPIVPGQTDVRYLLRRRDGAPGPPSPGTVGNGEETFLTTPAITEDVTYRVLARKVDSRREAFLHQMATVKVGLELNLQPRIEAPPLDPVAAEYTDPRILDYGSPLVVTMDVSQAGVDYRLVHLAAGTGEEESLSGEVRGDGGTVTLTSAQPASEDILVRVRATKRFDPAEEREDKSSLLVDADGNALELPLMVRPNPALPVTVEPSNVIGFDAEATIGIGESQASCSYRAYMRALADSDFLFDDVAMKRAGDDVAEARPAVDLGAAGVVRVIMPTLSVGVPPAGFATIGDAVAGNGDALRIPLGRLVEDSLVLVEASKPHSRAWLAEAGTALIEPDPDRRLQLRIAVAGTSTRGDIEVAGGQPGVFYYLRRGATGSERSLPAYFHQRDERDPALNKGLGGDGEVVGHEAARTGLRVEVDLAVARSVARDESVDEPVERAREQPGLPVVEFGRVPLDVDIRIRAVRARTGVAVELTHAVPIFPLPDIKLEDTEVDEGQPARIIVPESHEGDRYQVFLDGQPVKRARIGNGEDLAFVSEPIEDPVTFELRVTRPGEGADIVEWVALPVRVLPADEGS